MADEDQTAAASTSDVSNPSIRVPQGNVDANKVSVTTTDGDRAIRGTTARRRTKTLSEQRPVTTGSIMAVLTVAVGVCAWYVPIGTNWLVVLGLIIAFFLFAGKSMTGRALGILVNERNLMSLSQLQLVIWTALIISAFFVIAIERIRDGSDIAAPLAIGVDWKIWALLGMSTASFVGTPLLNANKSAKEPAANSQAVKQAAAQFGEKIEDVNANRDGILYGNGDIQDARFTDLFQGDELANTHLVDVGKLQMFFFTVIVAIAYGVQLYQLISYGEILQNNVHLPELDEGLLALMGVSHAGYLGAKSIDRTPTALPAPSP